MVTTSESTTTPTAATSCTMRMVYLDGDLMIGLATPNDPPPVPNQDWFMSTHYPRFVSVVQAARFEPAIYFVVCDSQDAIFDNNWIDPIYPELNGRRSMFWLYRRMKYMADHGLYIPPRVEVSQAKPKPKKPNCGTAEENATTTVNLCR